jgi:KTSC domain
VARDTKLEYQQRKAAADRRGLTVRSQTQLRKRARDEGLDPNNWESQGYDFDTVEGGLQDRRGMQGPSGPSPDPDWDYYWPTRTGTPPGRKYTQFARYSRKLARLEVEFRDGTPWHWNDVPVQMWSAFKFSWPDTHSFIRAPGAPIQMWGKGAQGGFGSIVGE